MDGQRHVHLARFSQDHGLVGITDMADPNQHSPMERVLRIYRTDTGKIVHAVTQPHRILILELCYRSSLAAVVLGDAPRAVLLLNMKATTPSPSDLKAQSSLSIDTTNTPSNTAVLSTLRFDDTVLAVHMSRTRIVVVLRLKIHIFDLVTATLLHTLDTCSNSTGLVALAAQQDEHKAMRQLMVFNRTADTGELVVFDVENLRVLYVFRAHESPVTVLTFNSDATLLATCSAKGTVCRVFSMPDGQKQCTFRRGSYAVKVQSLAFNTDSTLLCLASASPTIHVFKVQLGEDDGDGKDGEDGKLSNDQQQEPQQQQQQPQSLMEGLVSYTSSTLSMLSEMAPSVVADYIQPDRHVTFVSLRDSFLALAVCFDGVDTVIVVTTDGRLCRYQITMPGPCKLVSETSLVTYSEDMLTATFSPTSPTN